MILTGFAAIAAVNPAGYVFCAANVIHQKINNVNASAMTKKIQLVQRHRGQIIKNESYGLTELKNIVLQRNQAHFSNLFRGGLRRTTLDIIFKTFSELIDLDQPGTNKVPRV